MSPSADLARFARPPYAISIEAFQQADLHSHSKARGLLRIATAFVVLGSGVVGFLGLGWLGLGFVIVNLFIMQSTFVGSIKGAPDKPALERSVEHVQVLAVILHRWFASDEQQVSRWLDDQPRFDLLSRVVRGDA